MKRKQFIRNISLLGAGITLAPAGLLSAKRAIKTYTLPEATVHIPHGNFANATIKHVVIPELDVAISVQQFMRNGINVSEQDVSVYTFFSKNEVVNICFTEDEVHTSGEIRGLELKHSPHQVSLCNAQFELILEAGKRRALLQPKR
jgi:hypothetical protein